MTTKPEFPDTLLGAIARGWCTPANAHKIVDPVLAQAIEHEVRAYYAADYPEAAEVCAQAYQVVGSLLSDIGAFDTEQGRKILDNLSQHRLVHDDILPWPSFAPAQANWCNTCHRPKSGTYPAVDMCGCSHGAYVARLTAPTEDANRPEIDYGVIAGMLKQFAKLSASYNDRGVSFRATDIGRQAAACEAMLTKPAEVGDGVEYDCNSAWIGHKSKGRGSFDVRVIFAPPSDEDRGWDWRHYEATRPAVPDGWQDIESAPLGTMILCADMVAREARHWVFVGWRHFASAAGCVTTPERTQRPATHWQPLPPPPRSDV